ncbi:hypothetical protein SADUNF_Sadunf03G0045500 [Salix dunnii]|uniref:DUF7722 domain-containing protein n=1 Tax=Salix dunnii TaxID=1413687 RepID=A0A835K8Z9_9ROSI|nr:hypothetical protein SADUNF_Sadunf03G0045500 [Salix dunnii]
MGRPLASAPGQQSSEGGRTSADISKPVLCIILREGQDINEGGMESMVRPPSNRGNVLNGKHAKERCGNFQMPLHYSRYTRAEHVTMPEWKLDCLLREYGLPGTGDTELKRKYAMRAFFGPVRTLVYFMRPIFGLLC